jgi:hypothetical protein
MARYTFYTGEPITVGFMRLPPGRGFWAPFMSIVGIAERGLPGWQLAAATALTAAIIGRIPGAADQWTVVFWGYVLFIAGAILVSFGRRIERTLEYACWVMMVFVIVVLLILDIAFIPASVWAEGIVGFFAFGWVPKGVDVLVLGALVGYSAYGGFGNNAITNWYRDKGFAMGAAVGYIPAAVGGKMIKVSPVGKVAPPTKENLERWKVWWKLLSIDQWGIFFFGSMIGMFLPAILACGLIPRGSALPGWGIAAYQGETLTKLMGPAGWAIALILGFWILYSTGLSNVDLVCRQVTDLLWCGSERARRWAKEDIRRIYYLAIVTFIFWGCIYLTPGIVTLPLILVAVSANIANFTMALSAALTIYMNRKFLPKEFQPALWRELLLVGNVLFFGFFFAVFILNQATGWRWVF